MLRTLRDAVICVIVERSVNWLAPTLLPYACLVILAWLTYDLLNWKPVKKYAERAYSWRENKNPVVTYVTVFVLVGVLLCFY